MFHAFVMGEGEPPRRRPTSQTRMLSWHAGGGGDTEVLEGPSLHPSQPPPSPMEPEGMPAGSNATPIPTGSGLTSSEPQEDADFQTLVALAQTGLDRMFVGENFASSLGERAATLPSQPEQVQPAQQSLQVHQADRQARDSLREAVQTARECSNLLREAVQTLQPGAAISAEHGQEKPPEPATPPYVPPNTQATPESPNTQATPESPNSPNKDPWRPATMGETYCQRCRKKIVVDIDSEFDLCQCWTAVPDGVTARRANLPRAPRFEEPAGDHSDQPREPGPLAKARIKVLRREMHQGGAGEVADGDESTADVLGSGVSAQDSFAVVAQEEVSGGNSQDSFAVSEFRTPSCGSPRFWAQVDDDTQAGNDEQPEEELEPPAKKPKVVDDVDETPRDC